MADDKPSVSPAAAAITQPKSDIAQTVVYNNVLYGVDGQGNIWQRHLSKLGWINTGVTIPAPVP